MRIGVDLDGVVFDFVESFRSYLIEREGLPAERLVPVSEWSMWRPWGLTEEEFWTYLERGAEEIYGSESISPIHGAVDTLGALREAGHSIHIVTHRRGPRVQRCTEQWLNSWQIPRHSVTYVEGPKTLVRTDVFLDDHIETLEVLAERTFAVAFSQPWNTRWCGIRVDDWRDFFHLVTRIGERP